jgi:hypothetical protein
MFTLYSEMSQNTAKENKRICIAYSIIINKDTCSHITDKKLNLASNSEPRFHVFPFSVTQPVPHSLSNYYTVFMLITAWMQNIYSNQFGNRTLKALMLPTLTGIVLFVILYNVVFFPHHYVHKMHSSCLLMLILKYLKQ